MKICFVKWRTKKSRLGPKFWKWKIAEKLVSVGQLITVFEMFIWNFEIILDQKPCEAWSFEVAPFLHDYFDGFAALKNHRKTPAEQKLEVANVSNPYKFSAHGLLLAPLTHATLTEERLMGIIELLGGLGGSAGLFTGISLISVVHICVLLYRLIVARCGHDNTVERI